MCSQKYTAEISIGISNFKATVFHLSYSIANIRVSIATYTNRSRSDILSSNDKIYLSNVEIGAFSITLVVQYKAASTRVQSMILLFLFAVPANKYLTYRVPMHFSLVSETYLREIERKKCRYLSVSLSLNAHLL